MPGIGNFTRVDYHGVLKSMKLEVAFLRHLSEMSRIGLIDCDNVYSCIRQMEELENATEEHDQPTFLFAQHMLRQAKKDAQRKKQLRS